MAAQRKLRVLTTQALRPLTLVGKLAGDSDNTCDSSVPTTHSLQVPLPNVLAYSFFAASNILHRLAEIARVS